jgi:D-alanyl-D-alanine carboxypeptidase
MGGGTGVVRPRGRVSFVAVIGVFVVLAVVLLVLRWPKSAGLAPAVGAGGPGTLAAGTASASPGGPPGCDFGSRLASNADYADWQRTLVDIMERVPMSYSPPDLAPVSQAGFDGFLEVRSFVLPDLAALRQAAASAGVPLGVVAAYRSFGQQRTLFRERQAELGYSAALDRVALAGHSEHQLGTAIDFTSAGRTDVTPSWAKSPAGRWMAENAWQYGFVLSYPKDRTDLTCYAFEPWHFRYFGRDVAARIHDSGLTTREYLWRQGHGVPVPASP